MSFHDRLAEAALRDGNTAEQFRAAAQKHANAFWFYAAIGAAVWYFAGWGWSLIPLGVAVFTALQSASSTLTARRLEQLEPFGPSAALTAAALPAQIDLNDVLHVTIIDLIREKYSAVLADQSQPYAGCLYWPTSLLPYPKRDIKRALNALLDFVEGRRPSTLLDVSIRTPELAETLRIALIALDNFLDVPTENLPTNPQENALVGARLSRA